MRGFLAAAAVAAALVASGPAHAGLDFNFSFTGDATGFVLGTVTGEIFGLTDDATSVPTDLVITSAPAGLGMPAFPYDLSNAPGLHFSGDTFTVSGGAITATDFSEISLTDRVALELDEGTGDNILEGPTADTTANAGGFTGVTYTSADTSDVPEPATAALLLSGLFGLRWLRRRSVQDTNQPTRPI